MQQTAKGWDTGYEWKIILVLSLTFGLVGLDRFILPTLFPAFMGELGLTRHEALAREQLAQCQSELAGARLLTEGERAETVSPDNRDQGRFLLCPGPTASRAG